MSQITPTTPPNLAMNGTTEATPQPFVEIESVKEAAEDIVHEARRGGYGHNVIYDDALLNGSKVIAKLIAQAVAAATEATRAQEAQRYEEAWKKFNALDTENLGLKRVLIERAAATERLEKELTEAWLMERDDGLEQALADLAAERAAHSRTVSELLEYHNQRDQERALADGLAIVITQVVENLPDLFKAAEPVNLTFLAIFDASEYLLKAALQRHAALRASGAETGKEAT